MPGGLQIFRRRAAAALGVPTVALCGCAGSGAPAGTGSLAPAVGAIARGRPARIYRAALSGAAETPAGPARGRGVAIIAFHGQSVVCWRFAHLHGFTNATSAAVHVGATKRSGPVVIRAPLTNTRAR